MPSPDFDDSARLLGEAVERLLADHCDRDAVRSAAREIWDASLWQAFADMGLPMAMVSEAGGGAALDPAVALGLARLLGASGASAPLAETMVAAALLDRAGLAVATGPLALADDVRITSARLDGGTLGLEGVARGVPNGREVHALILVVELDGARFVATIGRGALTPIKGSNIAGEQRDDLHFAVRLSPDCFAPAPPDLSERSIGRAGAAIRALHMAGALETLLNMTVDFARERRQFGRPIAAFQAVQQNLALLTDQVAVARTAADLAAAAALRSDGDIPVAMAKIRCGEAAGMAASIAHQIHGAIGFTEEHDLHHFTKRLWAWRDECGNEATWSQTVGDAILAGRNEDCWPQIVGASVR